MAKDRTGQFNKKKGGGGKKERKKLASRDLKYWRLHELNVVLVRQKKVDLGKFFF